MTAPTPRVGTVSPMTMARGSFSLSPIALAQAG